MLCIAVALLRSRVFWVPSTSSPRPTPIPTELGPPLGRPKTPGVDLHECQCVPCPPLRRRRSFARAANVLTVPILSSGRLPPRALPRHPHVSSTTAQHSRVSATLEPASHKLSEPSWNLGRLRYVGALLQPRDLRIELPIEGLIATNKRAAVQGSSSVLRPRPRLYCFSLHFTIHPPTVLFSRPRFPLSSGYLRFLIFPRVHHAPGRVVMNVNRHDPSTETPPVSSARIEFPVTSRTRHSR